MDLQEWNPRRNLFLDFVFEWRSEDLNLDFRIECTLNINILSAKCTMSDCFVSVIQCRAQAATFNNKYGCEYGIVHQKWKVRFLSHWKENTSGMEWSGNENQTYLLMIAVSKSVRCRIKTSFVARDSFLKKVQELVHNGVKILEECKVQMSRWAFTARRWTKFKT